MSAACAFRCDLQQQQQQRGARPRHDIVVPSAATTEPPQTETGSSVVGDMERGSLAEKSGRSDGQLAARWREIHGSGNWDGLLDPIDTVLRGELIRYGEFAQACYDSDYDRYSRYCGTCRYPPPDLFRGVGLDGVGYEVTRYLYATSPARLPSFSDRRHLSDDPDARLWSETASFIGFVAVSTDEETARIGRRDIAVAWRGTVTRLEWVADLTAAPRPVTQFGIPCPDPRVKVESGFAELYTGRDPECRWSRYSAREQVLAEVRKLVERYHVGGGEEVSVTVTGHSLGAALATLSAFDVAETRANVSSDGRAAPVCVLIRLLLLRPARREHEVQGAVRARAGREGAARGERARRGADGARHVLRVRREDVPGGGAPGGGRGGAGRRVRAPGGALALDHKVSPFLKDTMDLACYHNLEAHLHLLDGYQGRGQQGFRPCGRDPALVNKAADFLRDEHMVPPEWRQDENKGMVRTEDGRWVLPPRGTEVHDHPEDTDHHLQQLGLTPIN